MVLERILIIDDSPIDARFASKILTEAGYSTTIIHDAQEALGVARQLQPDLILLDVTMPKMDGYQVCQHLKADPDTRDIATVLYTIRDQFIDCLRGIEAGADDFIIKTLSTEDFLNNVKKILGERRLGYSRAAEALNLPLVQPLAKLKDRHELAQILFSSFNRHVREAMSVILGAHVTSVLVDRAIEKVSNRYPVFRKMDQTHVGGLMFDSEAIQQVPAFELIDGFQAFNNELYQLVTKLTRTRINGVKEARAVASALQDMVRELHAKYEELHGQMGEPVVASEPEAPPASNSEPSTPSPATLTADCTFDSSGNLIYSDDDLSRLVGYSKTELMGSPFSNLLTPEGRQAFNRAFDRLVEKGAAQTKLQLKAKDGTVLHAGALLNALYDSQGRFAMTRCALQVVPASLLVQERDEHIEKLKRALHNLNEEFSTLASTISHDLRQPLHAILVLCQFLEEESASQLDEQARGYIGSIEQAGTKMKEMVEDLVHYARITSNSNAYEPVNLRQLMEEVREDLSATLVERGAHLRIVGDLPTVTCDCERFKELVTELITNGIKYNDKTEPAVEVGVVKEDLEGHTFYVKDNGIGIEEPYHESIFRLFHRLHKPEEYSGTGAGLAVARRIVDSHGGRIWVRSQPGAGATVFFTLPRDIPSI
jgi:PAS domain S-box-containing protein